MDDMGGPHFDPTLIGPNGKLARLHKGKVPYNPPPPPAAVPKESDAMVGALQMQEDMRMRRRSLAGSFLGGAVQNVGSRAGGGASFLGQ